MNSDVLLQITALRKRFRAKIAHKRSLSCMHPQMDFQASRLHILFRTIRATKQFVTRVILHMFVQTWRPFKSPTAHRAQVRFTLLWKKKYHWRHQNRNLGYFNVPQLSSVLLFMFTQIRWLGKRHVALITLVRFEVEVNFLMTF